MNTVMIQRIQSVYLSLTILLSLLFLNGSFLTFIDNSGSIMKIKIEGITRDWGVQGFEMIEKLLPLSAIIISIPAISLIALLFFRYRKVQLRLVLSLIILVTGLIIISFYYSYIVISKYNAFIVPTIKMIIPGLLLVLVILAYRGIRKDDRLVKSYDRLR